MGNGSRVMGQGLKTTKQNRIEEAFKRLKEKTRRPLYPLLLQATLTLIKQGSL